jgi:diguanylate cyclase (GGDEF)-like protein
MRHATDNAPAVAPRAGLRFRTKLLFIFAALIVGLQAAGWLTIQVAVTRSVSGQLTDSLDVGARVWGRINDFRQRQLLERVAVLADDFGFKEAIATQDGPTLESVLESASSRVDAPFGVILAPDGRVLARRLPEAVALPANALAERVTEARAQGFSVGVVVLGDDAFSYALVPVFAPDLVGWMAMAKSYGVMESDELAEVTELEPTLLVRRGEGWHPVHGRWLPDAVDARGLDQRASRQWLHADATHADPALAIRLTAETDTPAYLVLVAKREKALGPYAALQSQVLWQSLAAALLALVAAFLIGRRVSGPVSELARAADRIRDGEYATPLHVAGADEFATLAQVFNAMQEGIAERERRILFQSGHDALTALPNRERAITLLQSRLQDPGLTAGGLVMVDLRRFREINDLLGHRHGDLVLVEVARRLLAALHEDDLVARLSGDEFLVALWGVDGTTAMERATSIVATLTAPTEIEKAPLRLEVDLGVVPFRRDDGGRLPDARTLLRRVEIANELAKREGSTIGLYREGLDEQHLRQLAIVRELRGAIDSQQFSLVYQPKVDIATRQVRHVEALLRWTHPELGRIGPDEFIPLAERAGLVGALTCWVVERACADMAAWRADGIDVGVAINLSAVDLADAALDAMVMERVRAHSLPPTQIIVEVTESAVLEDLDRAIATLNALRAEGLRVSVDDFGTGQSSLGQLKHLPADELKIDKSFVLQLAPGSEDERIVQSIVQLGHALGLKVVAEGLETEAGLDVLARLHCDVAQGYHFSRPLPLAALTPWLHDHQRRITEEAAT